MGTISRTGITGGSTIQPTHITNIIDALDGTSTTTTVVATGSFTGSLVGALTGPVITVDNNIALTNNSGTSKIVFTENDSNATASIQFTNIDQ
jgi:hypothetical protein